MFFRTTNEVNFNLNQLTMFTNGRTTDPEGNTVDFVKLSFGDYSINITGEDAAKFLNFVVSTPLTSLSKPVFHR